MFRRCSIFVRILLVGAITASVCVAHRLHAQQPAASAAPQKSATPPGPVTTLSLDAHLVNLPVIVRDKKGAIIQNLTKDDFTLGVDGKGVTIRYFDKDNDLPLTLGLLVDISGSVRNTLDEERKASSSFIDEMITAPAGRQADRAFVMQFGQQTELLQDVTPSRPKLQAAIKELGSTDSNSSNQRPDPNDPNDPGNGGGSRRRAGGTTLYDAVFLAADELLSKQKGRKAIILLTDGDDNGSRESLNRSIEAAQRADTIVYAIYFKGTEGGYNNQQDQGRRGGGGYPGGGRGGIGFPGGGGGGYPGGGRQGGGQRPQEMHVDGKKILERMVGETGGRVFEESKKQDFAAIYDQIAEELRSQYRLGFTPDQTNMEDGYHRVLLDLPKKKDLKIQTRDGYYTGK